MQDSPTSDALRALAVHAATAPCDWAPDVLAGAARAFVDTIGVIYAGRAEPPARRAAATVQPWAGSGGAARDIVRGTTAPAPFAAFVNGTAAHTLDYDDVLEVAASHASAVLVPAVLALGQERGASGLALLDALLIGLDVQAAIAAAVNYAHYARGWHTTLTLGPPAAAAACGRLLGLPADRMAAAISAATSFSSGSKRQFGTDMKPVHAGMAAQAGIVAAGMAEAGITASNDILEGPWSFADLFGGEGMPGFAALHERLSGPSAMQRDGLWIKAWPCCASAHRPIDAMQRLRAAHGFSAADIVSAEALVSEIVLRNLMYDAPTTPNEAKFSLQHCLALAAGDTDIAIGDFSLDRVADPALQAFWPKVSMRLDQTRMGTMSSEPGSDSCTLTVTLRNNRTLSETVLFPKGHPGAALSDADLVSKFRDCTGNAGADDWRDDLTATLFGLGAQPDLGRLDRLLSQA
jgi:2-methylcitrate dehydratase PrpD